MTDVERGLALKATIELIREKGVTPQLLIDATQPGVVVLDWVKERFGKQLIIDLDITYPLNLVMDEVGVKADLAFARSTVRCTFPWDAIIAVRARDPLPSAQSVLGKQVSTRPKLGVIQGGKAPAPKLTAIPGGKKR